jgi:hypothetical protein
MLNEKHWSQQQEYITGDVFENLLAKDWQVNQVEPVNVGRAKLYSFTLERDGETVNVRVLDCPVARQTAQKYIQ